MSRCATCATNTYAPIAAATTKSVRHQPASTGSMPGSSNEKLPKPRFAASLPQTGHVGRFE